MHKRKLSVFVQNFSVNYFFYSWLDPEIWQITRRRNNQCIGRLTLTIYSFGWLFRLRAIYRQLKARSFSTCSVCWWQVKMFGFFVLTFQGKFDFFVSSTWAYREEHHCRFFNMVQHLFYLTNFSVDLFKIFSNSFFFN